MPQQSFADLGVSNAVCTVLEQRGFTAPFAVQELVLPHALGGRDVLAQAPTGSGKTLAFGIPLVERMAAEARRPGALILTPTRELATQIVEEIREVAHARALKVIAVYGGAGITPQIRNAPKAHIVVATPGRLEDLLQRGALSLANVETLILDEADRMVDMGFKPAVDRIVRQCADQRQTMVFSATFAGTTGKAALTYTSGDAARVEHQADVKPNVSIEHRFVAVTRDDRVDTLTSYLQHEERERALIFVRTKRGADRLTKKLVASGVNAVAMHGDKTQGQRERALAAFTAFKADTLVATDVAARGLDVAGISHVINFDPPEQNEDYVHRVGRTGRAGRTGVGVTFVDPETARDVERLADQLGLRNQFRASGLQSKEMPKPTKGGPGPRSRANVPVGGRDGGRSHSKPKGGRGGSRPHADGGAPRGGGSGKTIASASPSGRGPKRAGRRRDNRPA